MTKFVYFYHLPRFSDLQFTSVLWSEYASIQYHESGDKRARPIFSNRSERTRNTVQFSFESLKLPHGTDKSADEIRGLQANKFRHVTPWRENIKCFGKPYRVLRHWINETSKGCRVSLRKTTRKYQANQQLSALRLMKNKP